MGSAPVAHKPLFRMTMKRRLILERAITSLKGRIEHNEGFAKRTAESEIDATRRESRIAELAKETERLKLASDVIVFIIVDTISYGANRCCL